MKKDFGLSNYSTKKVGVFIFLISLFAFFVFSFWKANIVIYKSLNLNDLIKIGLGIGLYLIIFSKSKIKNKNLFQKNILNRLFLTAIYATLLVYSTIQYINNDYTVVLYDLIILFLSIHALLSIGSEYKKMEDKTYQIIMSIILVLGLILLFIL